MVGSEQSQPLSFSPEDWIPLSLCKQAFCSVSAVPYCLGGVQERPALRAPLRELQAGLLWLQELFSLGVSMLCSHAVFLTCYCRAIIVVVEGWEFACCDLFKIF